MRKFVYIYVALLALQYALNPLVPHAKISPVSSPRGPASVQPDSAGETRVLTDEFGLIVQADGDGGDTAQRTGMFYFLHDDPEGFARALDQLEAYPGIYVRHPAQNGPNSDPSDFSRDQQRPLIIALGKYAMKDRLTRMATGHLLRLGKYQNLDLIGPVGLGEYIRAFDAKIFYPLLFSTDAFLFFSSLYLVTAASFDPDEVDDNNHAMTLIQSQNVMPTPLGWLALKTYLHLRPRNYGNTVLDKENAVQGALAWYHRAENGGNPYIGEALFAELLKAEEHDRASQ